MGVHEKLTYVMYPYTSFDRYVPRATGGWAGQVLCHQKVTVLWGDNRNTRKSGRLLIMMIVPFHTLSTLPTLISFNPAAILPRGTVPSRGEFNKETEIPGDEVTCQGGRGRARASTARCRVPHKSVRTGDCLLCSKLKHFGDEPSHSGCPALGAAKLSL